VNHKALLMFPTPSLHSVPPSSRPSVLSEANLSRLRSRLHQSGAIISSRSVASRADAQLEFDVVDVGEGHHPTGVEQLLARLEQHGLRRRLAAEDDAASYAVDVAVRAEEERQSYREAIPSSVDGDEKQSGGSSRSAHGGESGSAVPAGRGTLSQSESPTRHEDADAREPYYYLCVPCELRLTRISRRAPPWRALEDVHYHFSSAAHRSTASWMADDDIDATLHCTPLVEPTSNYSRIFLNGIPTLLSRRPGGGDMFYPLPHELNAVPPLPRSHGVGRESGPSSRASSVGTAQQQPFPLFPSTSVRGESGGSAVLWHRALPSVYTTEVQLLRRAGFKVPQKRPLSPQERRGLRRTPTKIYRVRRHSARAQVFVDHVDLQTYQAHSRLPPSQLPLVPAVLPIHRARIAKTLLKLEDPMAAKRAAEEGEATVEEKVAVHVDDPHRMVYTQSDVPLAEGWGDFFKQGGGDSVREPPLPLTVFEEESYRVALLSSAAQRARERRLPARTARESTNSKAPPVVLTRELLTQHTHLTSQAGPSPDDADVSASMARTSRSWQSSVPSSSSAQSHSRFEAPSRMR
jgi:hypothetical protein